MGHGPQLLAVQARKEGRDAVLGIRRTVGGPLGLRAPDGDLAQAGRLATDPRPVHPVRAAAAGEASIGWRDGGVEDHDRSIGRRRAT